jgi:hypothetical protein
MLTNEEKLKIINDRISLYNVTLSHFDNIMNDKIVIDETENMNKETIPHSYEQIQLVLAALEQEKALLI